MIKILLVDDESWSIAGIRELIDYRSLGLESIGEARNGLQAIKIIEKDLPQIIITDIRMPMMDGIELVEYIHQKGLDIHVIIISGYSEFEYAKQAIDLGVFAYILKPVEKEELKKALKNLVKIINKETLKKRKEFEYSNSRIKHLIYYIENLYKKEVMNEIDYLFLEINKNKETTALDIHNTIISIIFALNNLLQRYNSSIDDLLGEKVSARLTTLNFIIPENLKPRLIHIVTSIMKYIEINKKSYTGKIIEEVENYIRNNYCEDISLQSLSDRYSINTAYLSRMFKSEVGMNFNEFLNQIRMETAIELLKNRDLKMKDIARLTGYSSSNYFFKKFKSYYRFTPSQFRETLQ